MIAENATLKRLHDEDDGDSRNTKIGYSLRGQPNDEELIMPMIVLLNTMLMNGYQRLN